MGPGIASPFIRLFYKNQELTADFQDMQYLYQEEGPDVCSLEAIFNDPFTADEEFWQEKNEIILVWGYIGEPNKTIRRKIYWQDLEWDYDTHLKLTIKATDKSNILRANSQSTVYNNSSVADMAISMAEKQGLKCFIELEAEEAQKNNPYYFDPKKKVVTLSAEEWKKNAEAFNNSPKGKAYAEYYKKHPEPDAIHRHGIFYLDPGQLRTHDSVPQAGRSDLQVLNEYGKKEPGGRLLIDSRDDSITVRKRNFRQTPYKVYEYKDNGEGPLLKFKPEFKNTVKEGPADNFKYTGWNASQKSMFSGNANNLDDNTKNTLTAVQQIVNFLKTLDPNSVAGKPYFNDKGQLTYLTGKQYSQIVSPNHSLIGENRGPLAYGDKTLVAKQQPPVYVTVKTQLEAYTGVLDKAYAELDGKNTPASSTNPFDAFNQAANLRREAELKRNPATLVFEGDPGITVGQIVSITGVAKKHAGNYYIISSSHKITKSSGYITECQAVRDGNNYKAKNGTNVKNLGKTKNVQFGKNDSEVTRIVKRKKEQ